QRDLIEPWLSIGMTAQLQPPVQFPVQGEEDFLFRGGECERRAGKVPRKVAAIEATGHPMKLVEFSHDFFLALAQRLGDLGIEPTPPVRLEHFSKGNHNSPVIARSEATKQPVAVTSTAACSRALAADCFVAYRLLAMTGGDRACGFLSLRKRSSSTFCTRTLL